MLENEKNILKILVGTDSHLGYLEQDPVRGLDSFAAFEEMFIVAKKHQVDFVLLGGDLFHDNKPSRRTLFRCMDILRRQCMGNEPISFQIISREEELFSDYKNHPYANCHDPFYSVGTPVFSIHGNHDDPVREVGANETELPLASLDILHKSEEEEGGGGQVNLFVLHQNREQRGKGRNYIKDQMIPHWMDLVIWGHEHEARGKLEESFTGNFHVIQPGSTVATSLVPGEAKQKQVVLLHIRGYEFNPQFVDLTQVRPFYYEEVKLQELGLDPNDHRVDEAVTKKLNNIVKQRIRSVQEMDAQKGICPPPNMDYPLCRRDQVLIRLSIDHTGFHTLHNQRFGSNFVGQVANPTDMLLFKRTANQRSGTARGIGRQHGGAGMDAIPPDADISVSELVLENLLTADRKLELISEHALQEALEKYVDQQEAQAIAEEVQSTLARRQTQMKELDDSAENITEAKVKAFTEVEKEKEKADRVVQPKSLDTLACNHIDGEEDEDFSEEELATTLPYRNGMNHKLLPDGKTTLLTPTDSTSEENYTRASVNLRSVTARRHAGSSVNVKMKKIVSRREDRNAINDDSSGDEEPPQRGRGKLRNYDDIEEVQDSSDEDKMDLASTWNKPRKPSGRAEKGGNTMSAMRIEPTTPAKKKRRMLPTYLQGSLRPRSSRELSSQAKKPSHSHSNGGTDYVQKWGSLS